MFGDIATGKLPLVIHANNHVSRIPGFTDAQASGPDFSQLTKTFSFFGLRLVGYSTDYSHQARLSKCQHCNPRRGRGAFGKCHSILSNWRLNALTVTCVTDLCLLPLLQVASELRDAGIPMILTENRSAPDDFRHRDAVIGPPLTPSIARLLKEAGVSYAIAVAPRRKYPRS